MNDRALADLGAPDLKLEGLQIWVHDDSFLIYTTIGMEIGCA
jgi:hypothetical protein